MQKARNILTRADTGLLSDILGIVSLVALLLGALHLPLLA